MNDLERLKTLAEKAAKREAPICCWPQDILDLIAAKEAAEDLLLRAYQSGHREGWEASETVNECMNAIRAYLKNQGKDPALKGA
jgi:hypothetical protein